MRIVMGIAVMFLLGAGLTWPQDPQVPTSEPMAAPASSPTAQVPAHGGSTPHTSASDAGASLRDLFKAADLAGKLKIIEEQSVRPASLSVSLYVDAVNYLLANPFVLRNEKSAQQLGLEAVKLIGKSGYRPAAEAVWRLFQLSDNSAVRLATLNALGIVARDNAGLVDQMNHWLAGQNLLHLSESSVNVAEIDSCAAALGELADPSSFPVLFSTMMAGYGEPTTSDARKALEALKGDRAKQLLQVVETTRFPVRLAAFDMAMKATAFTVADKASIATAALTVALSSGAGSSGSAKEINALRFEAVRVLGDLDWTPADGLLLSNFNRAAGEYRQGAIPSSAIIASANALADMSTHEAAVRLTLYLNMINSQTDRGRPFDHSITLAIVKDLGRLGDPVAYDTLFAMRYLGYPGPIQTAASEAVSNLSNQS